MGNFYSTFQLPPAGYIFNFSCAYAGVTSLTVTGGIARDQANSIWIAQGSTYAGHNTTSLTINSALSGAGGLDKGTIAINTWYGVLVVADSSGFNAPVAMLTILGASGALAPTLPLGYDSWQVVSYALTDGSAQFVQFLDYGAGVTITKMWVSPIRVLNGGTATSITSISAALAAIPFSAMIVDIQFTPATANDTTTITSYGVTGDSGRLISGTVAAKVSTMEISNVFVDGNTTFAYTNSAGSGATSLYVAGFVFQV